MQVSKVGLLQGPKEFGSSINNERMVDLQWEDENMGSKKLTKTLFSIYFIALVWIILFKMQIPFSQNDHIRSINLIPFAGSVIVNHKIYVQEIVYNVLIFLPFGVFSCMLGEEKPWFQKVAPSFYTSLTLEILQYVLAVGVSDITDLFGNTAGGMLGLGIFYLFQKLCKEKTCLVLNVIALVGAVFMLLMVGTIILLNQ